MTVPELVHRNNNPIRFSLISCVTEDSVESAALATPLDASPPPPPSNTFSIINIVNDDPLPNLLSFSAIAAARNHTTNITRPRAQTSPRPVPSTIIMNNIPQQQLAMIYDNDTIHDGASSTKKSSKFWPRIKRIMSNNNISNNTEKMKQLFVSMDLSSSSPVNTTDDGYRSEKMMDKQKNKSIKGWLGRNRSKVGPQR